MESQAVLAAGQGLAWGQGRKWRSQPGSAEPSQAEESPGSWRLVLPFLLLYFDFVGEQLASTRDGTCLYDAFLSFTFKSHLGLSRPPYSTCFSTSWRIREHPQPYSGLSMLRSGLLSPRMSGSLLTWSPVKSIFSSPLLLPRFYLPTGVTPTLHFFNQYSLHPSFGKDSLSFAFSFLNCQAS